MKVDLDYMAKLLEVFISADTARITIENLIKSDLPAIENDEFTEKFIFHIELAIDNQLIGTDSGCAFCLKDIGIIQSLSGSYHYGAIPIRLTQIGHDFALSLNNKDVLSKLKSEFKDAPFKAIFETGQKLLEFYAQKKLESIMK
ncbi:DUF2513 domain-containing protein [Methylomonas sp. Kb3]|uniref:DUF2513 domain-containing protein n=1 Tax=Methylomonas sp. Kb3 TaxID=1611544 RepID=UPI000C348D9C|nr:DUF2513 domain-containing protein [Methylomonas sp. Kb3]PKD40646.1 DUF2513 domain-containing protein [Methylomonas sp. Kb3]